MNITQEKINNSTLGLKFEISLQDYYPQLQKELKELQKKANMPGFRPGKVPFSLVQKMYGSSAKSQVINDLTGKELDNYIKENKIKHLFYPLLDKEKNNADEWINSDDFEIYFEIGLRPDIDVDLASLDIERYKIIPSEENIKEYIERIRQDFGHAHYHEEADEMDTIEVEIYVEIDEKEETLKSTFDVKDIVDENIKKLIIGCKTDDIISFNFVEAFGSSENALNILKLKKEDFEAATKVNKIKVLKISHFHSAELNEEFFKNVFPNEEIKTIEEFTEKVKQFYEKQLESEADYFFSKNVQDKLFNEIEVELPVDFIKKYLLENESKNLNEENIDSEIDKYIDYIKKEIIITQILEKNNISIKYEDVRDFYINNFLIKYLPPNLYNSDDDSENKLVKLADNMLKNENEYHRMTDILIDTKLVELFKEKIPLKIKEISLEEFNKK